MGQDAVLIKDWSGWMFAKQGTIKPKKAQNQAKSEQQSYKQEQLFEASEQQSYKQEQHFHEKGQHSEPAEQPKAFDHPSASPCEQMEKGEQRMGAIDAPSHYSKQSLQDASGPSCRDCRQVPRPGHFIAAA